MVTVRDIAKAAGVSLGTASRALTGNGPVSEDVRILVQETARQLGYEPRKKPSLPRQKAIGIVLPDISLPYSGRFLKFAEVELGGLGYRTVVCNTVGVQGRLTDMIELVQKHQLDGLILNCDVTPEEARVLEKLPVVSLEAEISPRIPLATPDHVRGGQLAAELLLQRNCKNVLMLAVKQMTSRYADRRISECKRILSEAGIKVTVAQFSLKAPSIGYIQELVSQYLTMYSGIDGIFTEDICAFACVSEALRRNISVPGDLKVIGYDGHDIGRLFSPPLTTVSYDMAAVAHQCIDLLMNRLDGQEVPSQTFIPVNMIHGGTA